MKKNYILAILLFFGFSEAKSFESKEIQSKKLALLIGVGDYPAKTGWSKIHSENDLELIQGALMKQGYVNKNISILKNEKATRKGILKALKKLTAKVKKGDVVYFHFSGHGQQIADDNREEADGFDEAIVPINSPMYFEKGVNEGQYLIRDDELGNTFFQIRKKLTKSGNLLVLIDACHSGTGTRGYGNARGTTVKMASKNYISTRSGIEDDFNSLTELYSDETDLAPMVAFFGSAQDQLNFETTNEAGKKVGSLSYAFSKKLSQAASDMTYRVLFEQIKLEMSNMVPRQNPQAEGMLDQQILGGSILGQPEYHRVLRRKNPLTLVIEGGWLKGMKEGSLVELFPPGTRDRKHKEPLARGEIIASTGTTGTLKLNQPLSRKKALAAWALVTEHNFGNISINVALKLKDEALKTAFEKKIKTLPFVNLADNGELIFLQKNNEIELLTAKEQVLRSFTTDGDIDRLLRKFQKSILAYTQSKFLRSLEYSNPRLAVTFDIIPVKFDVDSGKEIAEIAIHEKTDAGGIVRFKAESEIIKVRVTNGGVSPAYFTLIDLQPDNQINVLVPGPNQTPEEFRINPGESLELPAYFRIYPPYGIEVFKLISTFKPIDLRSVVVASADVIRGAADLTPVEKLFSKSFFYKKEITRGQSAAPEKISDLSVFSKTFVIDK